MLDPSVYRADTQDEDKLGRLNYTDDENDSFDNRSDDKGLEPEGFVAPGVAETRGGRIWPLTGWHLSGVWRDWRKFG